MSAEITRFADSYRFLSNFWLCEVTVGGLIFPSSEHAYQALKTLDSAQRICFTDPDMSPGQAKRAGRTVTLRADWEQVKKRAMFRVVLAKFIQNPDLAKLLEATGDMPLEEGNTWHDNYWGACGCTEHAGYGLNYLGRILMMVRDLMKAD